MKRPVYLKISTDPSGFVSKRPEVQGFQRMRPALVLEAPFDGCGSRRSPSRIDTCSRAAICLCGGIQPDAAPTTSVRTSRDSPGAPIMERSSV